MKGFGGDKRERGNEERTREFVKRKGERVFYFIDFVFFSVVVVQHGFQNTKKQI